MKKELKEFGVCVLLSAVMMIPAFLNPAMTVASWNPAVQTAYMVLGGVVAYAVFRVGVHFTDRFTDGILN